MRVTTDEVEIRGKEVKTSQIGKEYIIVRAEDETGKIAEICDKTMSRLDEYRKGRTCRLILDINIGSKYPNPTIVGIVDTTE